MIAASSNLRSRTRPAARRMIATRSRQPRCAHAGCAARAAETARSTCAGVAAAKRPSTKAVSMGERSMIAGAGDGTASPAM